jgi:hypothetical protein
LCEHARAHGATDEEIADVLTTIATDPHASPDNEPPPGLTPDEHRRRWAELSPLARGYAQMWDNLRADTGETLISLFGADRVFVDAAATELFETFPEWETHPPPPGQVLP